MSLSVALAVAAVSAAGNLRTHEFDWGRSRFERVHSKAGWWNTRQVTVREGSGPPNITFEVAWKPNGSQYAISTFSCDSPSALLYTFKFKGKPTRFTGLRAYDVVPNDYYSEGGHMVKQFPSNVFVGKAIEAGRPTTYIWAAYEKGDDGSEYKPVQLLEAYGTDTRHLGGLVHGEKGVGDYLIEHAKADWISRSQWPKGATTRSRIQRKWRWVVYQHSPRFVSGRWQIEKP